MLLVDDQHSFQVMVKSMLFNMGITNITFADTPEDARKLCLKEQFDIYLIDYNLGRRENGRQLLESLRMQHAITLDAIVIIVSGDASRAIVLSALETEPDAYIAKPFSQEQLKIRLRQLVEKKQSLMPLYQAIDKGDLEKTIAQCDELLMFGTRYVNFCLNAKTDALLRLKRFDEVSILLDKILEKREQDWARLYFGILLIYQGKYQEAITHILQVIEHHPLMIDGYRWLAEAYQQMKEYKQAKVYLHKAVEYSPQSLSLQEKLAETALQDHDYLIAKDALQTTIDLSKYSIHNNHHFFGAYLNAIIMHALTDADPYLISQLKKQVNNAFSRMSEFIKCCDDFDLDTFEHICFARVNIASGDALKGKRMIYKIYQNYQGHLVDLGEESLAASILAMYQLGEKEFADQLKETLDEMGKHHHLIDCSIEAVKSEPFVLEKFDKCNALNTEGILQYQQNNFKEALHLFKEALRKSPGNTNAAINKAQSLVKLMEQAHKQNGSVIFKELKRDYDMTLDLLEGIPMTQAQIERFKKITSSYQSMKH